jgi:hypothetical protein
MDVGGLRRKREKAVTRLYCASTAVTLLTAEMPKQRIGYRRRPIIRKVKEGYKVLSEKGKNLGGPYKSKAEAQKRLRQVEYFKHKG